MTAVPVRWLTVFLDFPAGSFGAGVAFWAEVTGSTLSPFRGAAGEFATLLPPYGDAYLRDHVDQPCLDPPVLVQNANLTPPPTHRHSQFWPDPRTTEVGRYLVSLLSADAAVQLAERGDGGHD